MKICAIVLIGFALLSADTTEVIIGTPVTGNVIPFWGSSYDACRFQTFFLQSEISNPGRIIRFAFQPSSAVTGAYNNFKFYLCHTTVSNLSTTFNDNYSGNTPQLLIDSVSFTMGGTANQWLEWPVSFSYDNTSNLLVEIRWRSDGGVNVPIWRTGNSGTRRVWSFVSDTALTGQGDFAGYHVKLTIERTGVAEEVVLGMSKKQSRLSVIPNPVRNCQRVLLSLPSSLNGVTRLEIYDVAGKLVRNLGLTANRTAVWTLRDNNNVPVSAGIYFVKAGSATGRINILQ